MSPGDNTQQYETMHTEAAGGQGEQGSGTVSVCHLVIDSRGQVIDCHLGREGRQPLTVELVMNESTKISGKLTIGDWITDSEDLNSCENDPDHRWKDVFEKYFLDRLVTRYFAPMDAIERRSEEKKEKAESEAFIGEGFSIVTVQCSLIEFLQSTYEGLTYRHRYNRDPAIDRSFEYGDSGPMFKRFLSTQQPFATHFAITVGGRRLADEFYDCVRNGLLHEARTKGNWVIRPGDGAGPPVDIKPTEKIVYWKNFRAGLDNYITSYKRELLSKASLQRKFKQRLDNLFFR